MGKVNAWVLDMEEDAIDMTVEEWTAKHGESVIDVYYEARRKFSGEADGDPDGPPEGYDGET